MASGHTETETSRNKAVALASKKGTVPRRLTVDPIPAAKWVTGGQSISLSGKGGSGQNQQSVIEQGFAEYLTSSLFSVQRGDRCPRFAEKETEAREKIPYRRSRTQHIWHVHSGGGGVIWSNGNHPTTEQTEKEQALGSRHLNCSHCLGRICITLHKSFLSLELGFPNPKLSIPGRQQQGLPPLTEVPRSRNPGWLQVAVETSPSSARFHQAPGHEPQQQPCRR